MANTNFASTIMAAWDEAWSTSPDPFRDNYLGEMLGMTPRRSYREHLDQREINVYGNVIPRIERVKRHILLLGDPHLSPERLR